MGLALAVPNLKWLSVSRVARTLQCPIDTWRITPHSTEIRSCTTTDLDTDPNGSSYLAMAALPNLLSNLLASPRQLPWNPPLRISGSGGAVRTRAVRNNQRVSPTLKGPHANRAAPAASCAIRSVARCLFPANDRIRLSSPRELKLQISRLGPRTTGKLYVLGALRCMRR